MAYGRLDVFWPDGLFMTFPLVENNVSLGRSTGNTIVLDTSTISRYHLTITHDGENVFITDLESVNGTFIDGVKLTGNEPRPVYGGEEIQIGHLRLIYHHIDEQPTQPMQAAEETTQRIELQLPAFRIDVISPDIPVSPGAHATAEIAITNTSESQCSYIVSASGMPPEWVRIDRPRLTINAGDSSSVLINFRPLRRPDSKPGDYPITISVAQSDNAEARLEAQFPVHILPFGGFGMMLDTKRISSGERFRLHLHNQGSGVLPLSISGRDLSDRLRFNLFVPQVTLAPGQRMTVQGEVKPKNAALFGKPQAYPFDVLVRSNDGARFLVAERAQFIEKPAFPSWTPFVLVGLLGMLLVAVVVGGLILLGQPAPAPRIVSFEISSTQVARGEVVNLSWSAQNANTLVLSVDGTPVLTNAGSESSGVPLNTENLTGSVVLALTGANDGQQAVATQMLYVYQPMKEGFFTVTPTQMVRYVVQTLDVSWDVPGAVRTHLSGLEAFTTAPLEPSFGAQANLTGISGIPQQPFTLTLRAEDEIGNTREQTLNIQVVNPECAPAQNAVTLHAGPDARYQVVATVPQGTAVVVDAQDGSGRWLRAQLPGGLSGWGERGQFTCSLIFNPDNLYKELNVPPLPPPTVTPTRPPTVTPRPTLPPTATPLG